MTGKAAAWSAASSANALPSTGPTQGGHPTTKVPPRRNDPTSPVSPSVEGSAPLFRNTDSSTRPVRWRPNPTTTTPASRASHARTSIVALASTISRTTPTT
jgi:hypothetical protein